MDGTNLIQRLDLAVPGFRAYAAAKGRLAQPPTLHAAFLARAAVVQSCPGPTVPPLQTP